MVPPVAAFERNLSRHDSDYRMRMLGSCINRAVWEDPGDMSSNKYADEPATDVLAAEEFGVPAPDRALRPENLKLPSDLVGDEPREVLVAEDFAMPSPDEAYVPPRAGRRKPLARAVALNVPPLLGVLWLWRRLRRRGGSEPA